MIVSFRPLSGLLNQHQYIPLSFLPLELEIELASTPTANIISKGSISADADEVNISETWEISGFKVLCDHKYYSPRRTDVFFIT